MTTTEEEILRGHQPVGAKRWVRARQNAARSPESSSAQIYLRRLAVAEAVAAQGPDCSYEHWHSPPSRSWDEKYVGQTCSTECAILQLQLNLGLPNYTVASKDLEMLQAMVRTNATGYVLRKKISPYRKGKCLVCAGEVQIKP